MERPAHPLLVSHSVHPKLTLSRTKADRPEPESTHFMKSILLVLAGLTICTFEAGAALLIDEPFAYPDGPLVASSLNVWVAHSISSSQVLVISDQVELSSSRAEDVSRALPSSPYTNGFLYASFVLQCTDLPSAGGSYFLHFMDTNTAGLGSVFRGKVFASTAEAARGSFRLGVANGSGAATNIPLDLAVDVEYTVVLRYNPASAASTLWIGPNSEDSIFNRADGSDAAAAAPVEFVALRQASGIGVLRLDNLRIGTGFSEVYQPAPSVTNPPSISSIPDQRMAMNAAGASAAFSVLDLETAATNLVVSASSSNPGLVPDTNLILGGVGADRTITVIPAGGQQGNATITITVTDGDDNSAVSSFAVWVGTPSISGVANQITPAGVPTPFLAFTVSDVESSAGSLIVSAESSNPVLVPIENIILGGGDSNRTAVIAPVAGQSGLAVITFIVSDGSSSASNSFTVTVAPTLPLDLDETFSYGDGLLSEVSSAAVFPWSVYSPQPSLGDCRVVDQRLFLAQTNSDDARVSIGSGDPNNGCYGTNLGYVVYYSLVVNVTALPSGSGGFFALLTDKGAQNFRGRLFAGTSGAAPGCYRVGLANGATSASAFLTNDLAPGSAYTLTVRYNVGTGESRLWLNALSEASPAIDAGDPTTPVNIWSFAFRQATGMGDLYVDNLKVGTRFQDVLQAPNWPPAVTRIPDQVTPLQTPTEEVSFVVGDLETPASDLTVAAASTNPALVPVDQATFGGGGSNRTVKVTPAAGQSGSTVITLTVTDAGGNVASDSFLVTVLDHNGPPVISAIAPQSIRAGTSTGPIPFTVHDPETPAGRLLLGGFSGNRSLVPDSGVVIGGSGTNRTVTVTPAPGHFGTATLFLTASDGFQTTTNTFPLVVKPGLLLADTFSYPDGPVTTNSGFLWTAHSGATGETRVVSGKLLLSAAQSEDVNAALTNAPYPPNGGQVLYAGFTVVFSKLPGGQYFAHFKDGGLGYRGRVFATVSNASPGCFRLGVANEAGSLSATNPPFPVDLSLGAPVRVVLRYDVEQGLSTLWVNGVSEADASVTATDPPSTITVSALAFRQTSQNGGMGDLSVDDLLVGTDFDLVKGQATAAAPLLGLGRSNNVVRLSWPLTATEAGFGLQTRTSLGTQADWLPANLPVQTWGSSSIVLITNPSGCAFFRLKM
jgi:hypothetical protein